MNVLEIKDLTVEYYTRRGTARAVDRVTLTVGENKILGLAGESGCGKSTLGRAITRLVPYPGQIVGGEIILDLDRDIEYEGGRLERGRMNLLRLDQAQMRALRGRIISYIFQDPMTCLNPMMTIGEHFVELIKTHDTAVSKSDALERARAMLSSLGISPQRIHDYPHQFSGGMRQRVMIGLGLILNPRLLIADEPTTSLDVIVEAQIVDQIAELKKEFNLTMILITHNLGVLAQTTDDVAIIYAGRIVEMADTEHLFQAPQHPYTKALLLSVPDVTRPDKRLSWIPGQPPDLTQPIVGCAYAPRCPHATELCHSNRPELQPSATGGLVACHYSGEV